jgi:hypothetical protein
VSVPRMVAMLWGPSRCARSCWISLGKELGDSGKSSRLAATAAHPREVDAQAPAGPFRHNRKG